MYYTLVGRHNLAGIINISAVDISESRISLKDEKGNDIGLLTNKKASLIPGTIPAINLTEKDVIGKAYVLKSSRVGEFYFHMVDLFPKTYTLSENKIELKEEVTLLFGGAASAGCPAKGDVLDSLKRGETVPVTVSMETRSVDGEVEQTLVAKVNTSKDNRCCGRFVLTQEMPSFPSLFIKKGVLNGFARTTQGQWTLAVSSKANINNFEVVILPEDANNEVSFDMKIKELNDSCIDHPQNLMDKISYMRASGISDIIIGKVLDSYISYDGMLRTKIKKPKTLFLDTDSERYLKRTLVYALCGSHCRLVGDKGCGKNTLLDTLSWLLNQPLFKIGCNEKTDEYTLFGSTQIKDGDTFHKLSPFAKGLIHGGICVLDEANAALPELLITVNQLADDTREVDLANYGLLKLHDRTRIFMTMNEEYEGVGLMNKATVDRFQGVFLVSGMDLEELLIRLVPDASKEAVKICCNLYDEIETRVMSNDLSTEAITIRGYKDALQASALLPMDVCLQDSIAGRIQDAEERRSVISLIRGLVTY